MSQNTNGNKVNQVGGGSDFSGLWYSWEVSPAELSRITLEKIDCSPMFNPLRKGTVIPTGTSGIIPTGVYLAALPPIVDSCATVECFNRNQVGLVTDAEQIALQQAVANTRLRDQQFVRQLAAQEGLAQQTGLVSDNNLINNGLNSLAQFMGMNPSGPSQTGSGCSVPRASAQVAAQAGGNSSTIKYVPASQARNNQNGGCCGSEGFYTGSENYVQRNQSGGSSLVPRATSSLGSLVPRATSSLSNCVGCGFSGGGAKTSHMTLSQKAALAQSQHVANMSKQTGGTCAILSSNAPFGKTTAIGPNQTQQGGTLSNGLGYSPFIGSQLTATSCANSCVPFNNTCGVSNASALLNAGPVAAAAAITASDRTLASGITAPGMPAIRGRQPVYYSETESREGCTSRCRMPPGRYADSNLGCRATAFASRDIDYGTYDDLHGTNIAANAAPLPQACIRKL